MTDTVPSSPVTHDFTVGDALTDIPSVLAAIDAHSGQGGLTDDQRFALQVCLEEVLANLILHGQAENGVGKNIRVALTVAGKDAQVCVTDTCLPFDPTQPPPAIDDPQKVGGRGLKLLHSFSRSLAYRRVGNQNSLEIVV